MADRGEGLDAGEGGGGDLKGQLGKRKDVKKAYGAMEEGNTIDVTTGL